MRPLDVQAGVLLDAHHGSAMPQKPMMQGSWKCQCGMVQGNKHSWCTGCGIHFTTSRWSVAEPRGRSKSNRQRAGKTEEDKAKMKSKAKETPALNPFVESPPKGTPWKPGTPATRLAKDGLGEHTSEKSTTAERPGSASSRGPRWRRTRMALGWSRIAWRSSGALGDAAPETLRRRRGGPMPIAGCPAPHQQGGQSGR